MRALVAALFGMTLALASAGCADMRQARHETAESGKEVGHKVKEAAVDVGHAAEDAAKKAGHAVKDAAHEVHEDLKKD